jgi:cyanophycinase-like exopeptidase
MKHVLFLLVLTIVLTSGYSQNFTSYFTGNSQDALVTPKGGICLMGGASEHDNAMRWFLGQANGGDVLVLRASGSDGYNAYFYSQLGVTINSVETVVCLNLASGNDPVIIDKINKAEAVWFAGGDQWDYISYWRNTAVNVALNDAINRGCVIGGTSAGMAILGGHYFTAENGTVSSNVALNNPFNSLVTVSNEPFLNLPFLSNVITDTHYDNPDRRGRHSAFIAKQTHLSQQPIYGIACEEYVAVCIDTSGFAKIYGEYPQYDEQAYFIQVNCEISMNYPETCENGLPLTWNQGNQALKVFKANGTMQGTSTFDLSNWQLGTGGSWEHWWVENGTLTIEPGDAPTCISGIEPLNISLPQNPIQANQWIYWVESMQLTKVISVDGQTVNFTKTTDSFQLNVVPDGVYFLQGIKNEQPFSLKVIVCNSL